MEQKPVGNQKMGDVHIAFAALGLVVGAAMWVIGARYTIDGVIWVVNWLLAFVKVEFVIETNGAFYLYASPLPIVFSLFEWVKPVKFRTQPALVLVWALVHFFDFATTFLGLLSVELHLAVVILATAVLSYTPEWIMRTSFTVLRKAVGV